MVQFVPCHLSPEIQKTLFVIIQW